MTSGGVSRIVIDGVTKMIEKPSKIRRACSLRGATGIGDMPRCDATMSHERNVGILIFNDVEVLDFCGPFEVFSVAGREISPRNL